MAIKDTKRFCHLKYNRIDLGSGIEYVALIQLVFCVKVTFNEFYSIIGFAIV